MPSVGGLYVEKAGRGEPPPFQTFVTQFVLPSFHFFGGVLSPVRGRGLRRGRVQLSVRGRASFHGGGLRVPDFSLRELYFL